MLSALVIAIDRFSAGYLGPYGNTWIDTPALNRLASQATLFENVIGDSPDLEEVYQSYWQGTHSIFRSAPSDSPSLAQRLEASGVNSVLLTDSPSLGEHALVRDFGDRRVLDLPIPEQPASGVEQTRMAQLFAEATQLLVTADEPFLLWLHVAAMGSAWDAPMQLREQFADAEDPSPSPTVRVPNIVLEQDHDPDDLLGLTHAYAGQVAVLDRCIGALVDAIDSRFSAEQLLLVLTSPRGFPLGEHGRVGACGDQLYSEVLQVPGIVRHPDPNTRLYRCHDLVQPPDLYRTLLDWFGQPPQDEQPCRLSMLPLLAGEMNWDRQLACARGSGQMAIRTPAWFLVAPDNAPSALYVKPDDRWEVNEVSDRCGPIAEQLREALERIAGSHPLADLPELTDELVEPSSDR